MKFETLVPFDNTLDTPYSVKAGVDVDDKFLHFHYSISGDLSSIIINENKGLKLRKWDLWEETCFEAFLKLDGVPWYIEFNFSSTTNWNCFYIKSYRVNEGEYLAVDEIDIESSETPDSLSCHVSVKWEKFPEFCRPDFECGKIKFGLTSIIEEKALKRYFSLIHTGIEPDFHNLDSFTYTV